MRPLKNLLGQKFERLTVLHLESRNRRARWSCLCDCGKVITVDSDRLLSGHTKSCGCFRRDKSAESLMIHGLKRCPEYSVWTGVLNRCRNKNEPAYPKYGGRNIDICEEWAKDFTVFYRDMGPRPSPKHTLERIDNDLGYFKDNCRWATRKDQNRNKRNNIFLTFNGERLCIGEWAEKLNRVYGTIYCRYQRGWPIEKILS